MLARSSDALIAVSPEVRDDLVELGVAPAEKIVVVRLGLDLDRRLSADPSARAAVRAELGIPDDGFLIGWLGRMTEIKRVDDLLAACARLRAKGVDAYLALVGDGPLRDELKDKAEALGIADRTRFVGFRESVGELYAAFDVVALTSANEGTPVTVIEALACGLPVVATDVGGVSDVVQDGRSGFLVPANDVAAVAERLEQLAGDPKLCSVMGENGRTLSYLDTRCRGSARTSTGSTGRCFKSASGRGDAWLCATQECVRTAAARSPARPSQSGIGSGSRRAVRSAGISASRSGRAPRTVFVPSSTVTGRSVVSRSVKQGIPSADVSS